jgi:hypothetical protein
MEANMIKKGGEVSETTPETDWAAVLQASEARAARLEAALRRLFGASQNEMVSRGLPLEWLPGSPMGEAERALEPETAETRVWIGPPPGICPGCDLSVHECKCARRSGR